MRVRTRTRGGLANVLQYNQIGYPQNCTNRVIYTSQPATGISDISVGRFERTIDVVTDRFWARQKQGEVIFNPFFKETIEHIARGSTSVTHTLVAPTCTAPTVQSWYTDGLSYFMICLRLFDLPVNIVAITSAEIQNLQAEVWTNCLAKRGEGLTNLVESLAELDKAFAMVVSPMENIRRLIRDFRRNGRRLKPFRNIDPNSRALIRFVSAEWLRFRYGIMPLINDLSAGWKTLKKQYDSVKAKDVTVRAYGSLNRNSVQNRQLTLYPYLVSYQVAKGHNVKVRAMHLDRYKPTAFDDLGLTFHNVVAVPWELTRYSFVVDWFANIGPLIYANLPRVGIKSYGGCVSTDDVWTTFYSPSQTVSSDPTVWTVSGSVSDTYEMMDRRQTRNTWGDGDSRLVIKSDFRFDHWKRASDAFALTAQWLSTIGFNSH